MTYSNESLITRLSFFLICIFATISLIVLLSILIPKNVDLGLSDTKEQTSANGWQAIDTVLSNVVKPVATTSTLVVRGIGGGISSGWHAIVIVPGQVARATAHFIASATDVHGFIRPSDRSQTVVITPVSVPVIAKVPEPIIQQAPSVPKALPVIKAGSVPTTSQTTGNNLYARGNCTWWVAKRRAQINNPIPNWWGNASAWASSAKRSGYVVDHTPSPGAIMQTPYAAGGYGHVALVESVDRDGTWHISEMNAVGYNIVSYRTLSPLQATHYNFIHN